MSETYLGNPNLKRSNVPIEFTNDNIQEYIKCSKDPIYFIKNYIQIVNIDRGLIPFDLYDFQEDMVETFGANRFVICKLPRQSGKSTTVTAYMLWLILFSDNQNIAILANKGALARELLGKIQLAYEHLPVWLQQGITVWNKGNIELENGSKIVAAATSSSAIRGGSYNLIFLDEFAFVGNNMADEFFSSVYPTISSGLSSKIFIVSTPNGMNHFYKLWADAEEGNNKYATIEVHWDQVPNRDQKWKEETIANTSEAQFRQEFECEFLGSSNTLIHPTKLKTFVFRKPISIWNEIEIYQEPIAGHEYVISADTSRGLGLDYSAFLVFDITEMPYRLVAKYRNQTISPLLYPSVIYAAGMKFNAAFVMVEINDIGGQVADILHSDLEYENLLITTVRGRGGQQIGGGFTKSIQLGVRTTKTVKSIGCSNLKDLLENEKLIIEDFDLIAELSSFISRKNSFAAEEGSHDDLVMCSVLFGWLTRQTYFKDLTNIDIRTKIYDEKIKLLEDNALNFVLLDDGQPEPDVYDLSDDRSVNFDPNTANRFGGF
jgi:hypothetical protein